MSKRRAAARSMLRHSPSTPENVFVESGFLPRVAGERGDRGVRFRMKQPLEMYDEDARFL